MANPIWKDYFVDLGAVSPVQYRIKLVETGAVIYTGKAHKKPGEAKVVIKINDICADYLSNEFPSLSHGVFTPEEAKEFKVEKLSGSTWSTADTIKFLNDWSYDHHYNPSTRGLAFPIKNIVDPRQIVLFSGYNVSEVNVLIGHSDNTIDIETFQVSSVSTQENAFAEELESATLFKTGTIALHMDEWDDVKSITINGLKYNVAECSAKYVLYYSNAFGGWDFLLIEGNASENDSITRHTMECEYDNSKNMERFKTNHVNEMVKTITLNTGWLNDIQSERMHNLINSTNVFLCEIATGDMIPVTIPSTSFEYKTYKSNGNALVNYAIEVEIAHNLIRR